jgi:uncharacterized protein (TIGR03067 family)
VNPAGKPKTMDLLRTEDQEKLIEALYELDGDTLRVCYGSDERPTGFTAKKDSKQKITTFKRKK